MNGGWKCALVLLPCLAGGAEQPPTKGRVLDAITGKGIAGVRVMANTRPLPHLETSTDSGGNFTLAGSWADKLSFEREGYRSLSGKDVVGADGGASISYQSSGHQVWTPVLHMMLPTSVLSGVVLDERGRRIREAAIFTEIVGRPDLNDAREPISETDENGRFRVELNPVDTGLTVIDPRCRSGYLAQDDLLPGNPPRTRGSLVRTLRLQPGEHRDVRLTLPALPTYTVTGRVRNHVAPIPNGTISVGLTPAPSGLIAGGCPSLTAGIAQSGGTFSIDGVPPGRYRLEATLNGTSCGTDGCSPDPLYTVRRDIDVRAGGVRGIEMDILPGLELTGTVHWEGPPRDLFVEITSATGPKYADGAYERGSNSILMSRVQPGSYRLDIPEQYGGFYVREVRLNGRAVPSDAIPIGLGDAAEMDLDLSSNVANCRIQVVDQDRHPLNLYTSALLQKHGDSYSVVDSPHGYAPGQYLVVALTPAVPAFAFRPEILTQYANRGTPVSLIAGQTTEVEVVAIEAHPLSNRTR
jgi:hypothetical protein